MTKIIQVLVTIIWGASLAVVTAADLKEEFNSPPDASRAGVYWYFQDGNLDREMMEVDLDAMYEAGLRKALFLEINLGMPRGPLDFMSEEWQDTSSIRSTMPTK